jgi:hypothetical protein
LFSVVLARGRDNSGYRKLARGHAFAILGLTACGLGPAETPDARVRRDTRIVHEPCDTDAAGTEARDVDGDGRSDLRIVFRGRTELCRSLDFNYDGRVDSWVYRAPDGSVRRRESDFDRDGRIDEIAMYSGGRLTTKQVATNLAGRLDTWQYYEAGQLTRAERDSDGDSVVDQWWEYPRVPASDCALVHSDVDGDGRPDPGATVDLCKDEPATATPATATTSVATASPAPTVSTAPATPAAASTPAVSVPPPPGAATAPAAPPAAKKGAP